MQPREAIEVNCYTADDSLRQRMMPHADHKAGLIVTAALMFIGPNDSSL